MLFKMIPLLNWLSIEGKNKREGSEREEFEQRLTAVLETDERLEFSEMERLLKELETFALENYDPSIPSELGSTNFQPLKEIPLLLQTKLLQSIAAGFERPAIHFAGDLDHYPDQLIVNMLEVVLRCYAKDWRRPAQAFFSASQSWQREKVFSMLNIVYFRRFPSDLIRALKENLDWLYDRKKPADDDEDEEETDYSYVKRAKKANTPAFTFDHLHPLAGEEVIKFDRVYELNASKIMMPESNTYPLDRDAIAEWISGLRSTGAPTAVVDFAIFFQNNARHISFKEFYANLTASAQQLQSECEADNGVIVSLVPSDQKKSNYWVNLLIWPIIRKHVVRITLGLNWELAVRYPDVNVRYLYADDAAYSGEQASGKLTFYNPTIPPPNLRACVLIPFITEGARSLISDTISKRMISVEFFKARDDPRQLHDSFTSKQLSEVRAYPGFAKLFPTQALLYFDHKLPDTISAPDFLFALGPVYIASSETFQTRPLIANCVISFDTKRTYQHNGKVYSAPKTQAEKDVYIATIFKETGYSIFNFEFLIVCPPRFPASINYEMPR